MRNAHPSIVPYQSFEASDGPFIVAVGNDRQFETLCAALDRPDLAADPRYATNANRVIHRESMIALLQECFRGRKASEWIQRLEPRGIPCGPIASIAEAFASPQAIARGLVLHFAPRQSGNGSLGRQSDQVFRDTDRVRAGTTNAWRAHGGNSKSGTGTGPRSCSQPGLRRSASGPPPDGPVCTLAQYASVLAKCRRSSTGPSNSASGEAIAGLKGTNPFPVVLQGYVRTR